MKEEKITSANLMASRLRLYPRPFLRQIGGGGGGGRRLSTAHSRRNKRGEKKNEMPFTATIAAKCVTFYYILLFSLVLHRRLFCYAQQHQQSDDILLPTLCSENNEGYKRDEYFRLFALQKYQLRDETVKSIFGRKKQRKGRSVIYFGTRVSRETFFVFVLAG